MSQCKCGHPRTVHIPTTYTLWGPVCVKRPCECTEFVEAEEAETEPVDAPDRQVT